MNKIAGLFLVLFFWCVSLSCVASASNDEHPNEPGDVTETAATENKDSLRMANEFPQQVAAIKTYISKNKTKYSGNYAVLIDMKIPSQHYRLFVVDLHNDSIVESGIVAHGSGSEIAGSDSLVFSNTPGSYMTSLGIYKFGVSYQGNFGKSYRLHGLETSNNKAFERAVVFHSYYYVPEFEQTQPIMNSLGCPMVSPAFFDRVDRYIQKEKLPMLMKIYY